MQGDFIVSCQPPTFPYLSKLSYRIDTLYFQNKYLHMLDYINATICRCACMAKFQSASYFLLEAAAAVGWNGGVLKNLALSAFLFFLCFIRKTNFLKSLAARSILVKVIYEHTSKSVRHFWFVNSVCGMKGTAVHT
jgi:hypothetical protein